MSSDKSEDYKVGYGKPPKSGQFQPGKSGNPKGRPKGSLDFQTYVQEMLSKRVAITEGGKRKHVSALQATLMRLTEKSLKGDQRAMEKVLSLASDMAAELAAKQEEKALSKSDAEILARFEEGLVLNAGKSNQNDHPGEPDADDRD
ncbi:DUF5681 domain-containing protein [Roseovarius aestuariivivens]|uniref:DUF5681 domain-containing protein n=1 Tax=Roseovarius aestuariivivens TaxID=1888910 RepID=UPI00108169BB|nr:DUF5681 domain-containing protein [Roseovarius aestuariivivens]